MRHAETWGHLLEQGLTEAGIPAEVVNLGVGGYGMGQSRAGTALRCSICRQCLLARPRRCCAGPSRGIWPRTSASSVFYDLDQEPAQLALRLVETFKADVELSGSRFVAVHIPTLLDLVRLRLNRSLVYADLLAAMETRVDVVHTERELLEEAGWSRWRSLFTTSGHYTARGNAVIAAVATGRVRSAIRSPVGGGGPGPSSARSGSP